MVNTKAANAHFEIFSYIPFFLNIPLYQKFNNINKATYIKTCEQVSIEFNSLVVPI
jgi:hypothetical protein